MYLYVSVINFNLNSIFMYNGSRIVETFTDFLAKPFSSSNLLTARAAKRFLTDFLAKPFSQPENVKYHSAIQISTEVAFWTSMSTG